MGENGLVLTTLDGGQKWSAKVINSHIALAYIHFLDGNYGWVVGENGFVAITQDGGQNWTLQESGCTEDLNAVQFVNHQLGWAVGENTTLLRTEDGGATWSQVELKLGKTDIPQALSSRDASGLPPNRRMDASNDNRELPRPSVSADFQPNSLDKHRVQAGRANDTVSAQAKPGKLESAFPSSGSKLPPPPETPTAPKPFLGTIHVADATTGGNNLSTMETLHNMMVKGIISADEYNTQKAEWLTVTKLEKLHGLMLKGIISAEEYEAQKADLLKKLL